MPSRDRELLRHLYAFARTVDELGDGEPDASRETLEHLDAWIGAWPAAAPRSVPRVLATAVDGLLAAGLPSEPLSDLIAAQRVDLAGTRYATFADLLDYCRLSAQPVGRLVLAIMDEADAANLRLSASACDALQVIEHLQDVREDALRGRVYLPAADLDRFGVGAAELTGAVSRPALRLLIALEAGRARTLLREGSGLVARLSGWKRLAVAGYVAGGMAALDAIEHARHDVLATACRPSRLRRAGLALAIAASGRAA